MALPIPPLPREQPSPPRKLMKLAFLDDDRSGGGLGLVWLGLMIAGAVLGPLWIMRGPWPLAWRCARRWRSRWWCSADVVRRWRSSARRGWLERSGRRRTRSMGCSTGSWPIAPSRTCTWRRRPMWLRWPRRVRSIDPAAHVDALAPTVVRLALTPRLLRAARGRAPALSGGDLARLRTVMADAIGPLAATPGVSRLALGGEVDTDGSGPA
jgi:hypothetical protein